MKVDTYTASPSRTKDEGIDDAQADVAWCIPTGWDHFKWQFCFAP